MKEQEKKQKTEFKGNLVFIWLVGILVILLGCTIGYVCKLKKEVKELKQTIPQTQLPQVVEQQIEEQKQENETNTDEKKDENNKKVVNVVTEQGKRTEEGCTLIFYGKDKNDKTIWQYETKMGACTELTTVENLKVTNNRVYLNEAGTITVLNKETGKVIWQNSEYKGASSSFCFDDKETLYICGHYGPDLFIVDKNGKTIKILDFGDKYIWPSGIKLVNNKNIEVNVTIEEGAPESIATLVIDLNNYSIKEK